MKPNLLPLVEKHVEKLVIGVAAGFLVAMVVIFGIRSPNRVVFDGETQRPGELSTAILDEARELKNRMASARPAPTDEAAHQDFIHRIAELPRLPVADQVATIGGRPLASDLLPAQGAAQAIELVRPLPPTAIVRSTGRSLVLRNPPDPGGTQSVGLIDPPGVEVAWVSVGGLFDLEDQQAAIHQAGYEPGRARIDVTGVDAERRELLAAGSWSDWVRVDVSPAMPRLSIPAPVFDDNGRLINSAEMNETWRQVRDGQSQRMRPPFQTVIAGTEWSLPPLFERPAEPEVEVTGPHTGVDVAPPMPTNPTDVIDRRHPPPTNTAAQKQDAVRNLARAKKALARGDKVEARRLIDAVLANPQAPPRTRDEAVRIATILDQSSLPKARDSSFEGIDEFGLRKRISRTPVWFHDDTVEGGKTYQYRIRVNLWNRYLGRLKSVRNIDDAKKAVLEGDWSAPSEPIVVAPSTHFFVTSLKPGTHTAIVEVWKWRTGSWIRQNFEASVGDVIGGIRQVKCDDTGDQDAIATIDFTTGAVVLDLRLDEPIRVRLPASGGGYQLADRTSIALVYLDPADGQVRERIAAMDRNDPVRKRLQSGEK